MKRTIYSAVGCALLLAVGCSKEPEQKSPPAKESAPAQSGTAPSATQGKGTITGKVIFKGSHKAGKLSVGKDREVCGDAKPDSSLLVGGDGGLKNAVVQIAGLRESVTLSKDAVIDQVKCEYLPHVSVVPAGATVTFKNSDGILHNIHTVSQINSPFNRAQPKFMKEIKETFSQPEIVQLRCDVHGWMSGWIVVTENPFFDVTQSDGTFKFDSVPVGKYTLDVWHEIFGKATQSVEVKPGEATNVTFEFQMKK